MVGKRIRAAKEKVETKEYALSDAIVLLKDISGATKFDETIEIAMNLGVDPKHADQMVRGMVSLPNGTGKDIRVAVFANDNQKQEAVDAGADLVGLDDLIDQIAKGEINFDRCVATPDAMPKLSKVAKVLGPKGLMPNPKLGTVTPNVGEAVKAAKSGQVEFRVEKAGIIHAGVAKSSFDDKAILENIAAFISAVQKAKPAGAKGTYIKKITLTSTMGPAVLLNVQQVLEQIA